MWQELKETTTLRKDNTSKNVRPDAAKLRADANAADSERNASDLRELFRMNGTQEIAKQSEDNMTRQRQRDDCHTPTR
jgi:hypothetical protein